ncbi:hypothetical protein AWH60_10135 [Pseudoalteromonas haloplanktis]|nr:hypothetical protein AWH60_10135 [Pseudoalteromonas haloplanktis]
MLGNLLKLYVKENERSAGMNMRDERTIKLLDFTWRVMEPANIIINKALNVKLAHSAYEEFSDAADYIWKTPRFLESEKEDELAKLPIYFPNHPDIAEKRWEIEGRKIERTFPWLMSRGNLFSIASLYEAYLLLLAKEIEKVTHISLSLTKGQGISKINNYFKTVGLDFKSVPLFEQVDAALKIRNCLFHASGILDYCKKPDQIISIVDNLTFLSEEHRHRRKASDRKVDEVIITTTKFGRRIEIINDYSFLAANYLRDYFIGLCVEAKKKGKI